MYNTAPTPRTRARRMPARAAYERQTIDAILDEALVAHVGIVQDGQPYVIPTLHARIGDLVYIHDVWTRRRPSCAQGHRSTMPRTTRFLSGRAAFRSASLPPRRCPTRV